MSGSSEKYRLDLRLGGGGMAEVFVGSTVGAEGFSRKVAIKRVLPGYSDNQAFAQMFVSEAKITSRLVHPNIVSVLDFDRDAENRLFLVMELVEGKDLDTLLTSGPLPVPLIVFIISEVLRGLGHAHDLPIEQGGPPGGQLTITHTMRGVVHRDVSPHNVLLSWEGSVKVSDFGIAKARAASEATASTFIKGKPAYMSPEQANGKPLDGRSDLFAVGVMLWEMLIGRRLFLAEDTRATLAAVLFGEIPKPRALRGDVPKDLERITMKLLERDLAARYATAELAIADLSECSAAPKDGRALLKRTLAERFPHEAPVRGSQVHAPVQSPPYAPTVAAGTGGAPPAPYSTPGMPMASNPAMSLGPAATLPPIAPRRRWGLAVALAAILPLSALATYGLVSVVKGHAAPKAVAGVQPGTGSGSGSTPAGGSGAAVVATVTVPDAAVRHVPPDAPPAPPPPPPAPAVAKAKPAAAEHPVAPAKLGRLAVHAFPALTVFVDKKRIHDTPVTLQLPVGKHVLRLVNTEQGHDETLTVTITDGRTTTIDRE